MKAYVYKFYNYNNKIKVAEGNVMLASSVMMFICTKNRRYLVSFNEGEIIDNTLWFFKRDDQKAIDLFIDYKQKLIEELLSKVKDLEVEISNLNLLKHPEYIDTLNKIEEEEINGKF